MQFHNIKINAVLCGLVAMFAIACDPPPPTCSVPFFKGLESDISTIRCDYAVKDIETAHSMMVGSGKVTDKEFREAAAQTTIVVRNIPHWNFLWMKEINGQTVASATGNIVEVDCHGGALVHELFHMIEDHRGRAIPSFFHTHWEDWGFYKLSEDYLPSIMSTPMDNGEYLWLSTGECNLDNTNSGMPPATDGGSTGPFPCPPGTVCF